MTDVQRLQLETLFDTVHALDENSCGGWQPQAGKWSTRIQILKSILLSLASLIFVRTSTTVAMGTYGAEFLARVGKKQMGAQLVANEGVESLKADCELVSFEPAGVSMVHCSWQEILTRIYRRLSSLSPSSLNHLP